ncbi:MAG: DUF1275 domain-containing protein, partial [Bryobacterales bacterium]|nr:DUF1275 domain-containing protein [Bryobacterales bacterium]
MDSASDGKLVSTREASLAAALTCVGGYVDAIGYLSLGQVYVANMSGNSVSLGINSARLDWPQIWKHGWPILSYVVGLVMSRFIVTWTKRNEAEFGASLAFGLQAVLLMCFIALHSGAGGVFLCACAMGIQAATLSRFGGFNVYTAFVTGTLVKMGDALVDAFWAFWD